MKPFKIRDKREIIWVKQWFRNQIVTGRSPHSLNSVKMSATEADVLGLIDRLLPEERKRLQKSLSARRARASTENKLVSMDVTLEARRMLRIVAEHQGVTLSDVIEQTLAPTCDEIYRSTGKC